MAFPNKDQPRRSTLWKLNQTMLYLSQHVCSSFFLHAASNVYKARLFFAGFFCYTVNTTASSHFKFLQCSPQALRSLYLGNIIIGGLWVIEGMNALCNILIYRLLSFFHTRHCLGKKGCHEACGQVLPKEMDIPGWSKDYIELHKQ